MGQPSGLACRRVVRPALRTNVDEGSLSLRPEGHASLSDRAGRDRRSDLLGAVMAHAFYIGAGWIRTRASMSEALVTRVSYRRRRVKPTPTMPSVPNSKDDGSGTGLDTGEEARLRSPVVVPGVVRFNATPMVSE